MTAALLMALASLANANTVTLASFGTGQDANGANNTALALLGYQASTPITVGVGSGTTYNLTSGLSPWANAITGSNWVSSDPNSTVGLGSAPASGYYTYTTTFAATPGKYTGSLGTFADDTAEVFLNGQLLVNFDTNLANGPCAQDHNGPTCIGDPFMMLFSADLGAENVLTIVDWQSNGSAAGVDFEGSLTTATPEPGSLLLLGSGLASMAGFLFKKVTSR